MKITCRQHRWPQDAGFSILEMLVALSLLAILATMLFTGLRTGRLALERAGSPESELEVALTQSRLHGLLSQIHPAKTSNAPDANDVFVGDAGAVRFVSSYTAQSQISGLYECRLFLSSPSNRNGQRRLVLTQRLRRPNNASAPVLQTQTTLLEGVAGMRIRYFGQPDRMQSATWFSSWRKPDHLPQAIEIALSFEPQSRRSWHTMIVHLRLSD